MGAASSCMDLVLWGAELGCRIPDSLLVKALNPDPYDDATEEDGVDEETVRKALHAGTAFFLQLDTAVYDCSAS
jgi:hypothetical protein